MKQEWQGKILEFEPDASPEAWKHYNQYYSKIFGDSYLICSPVLFLYDCGHYISKSNGTTPYRLYALDKNAKPQHDKENNEYYEAVLRLSGETDFNFNKKHYPLLERFFLNKPEYLYKLKNCNKLHHSLINFSLMQTVGNMQGFKGKKCDDRLDKFIYYLGEFYDAEDKMHTDIIQYSSISNRKCLIRFLTEFKDLREYCEKVYFISDNMLINDLREHGKKELNTYESAKEYVELAYRFWENKEFFFSKEQYLVVGSYFSEGGETYTYEELAYKLTNDLGIINQKEIDKIIKKCLNRGFMHHCGNNVYMR